LVAVDSDVVSHTLSTKGQDQQRGNAESPGVDPTDINAVSINFDVVPYTTNATDQEQQTGDAESSSVGPTDINAVSINFDVVPYTTNTPDQEQTSEAEFLNDSLASGASAKMADNATEGSVANSNDVDAFYAEDLRKSELDDPYVAEFWEQQTNIFIEH
jgi:hypothetical protein